MINASVRNHAVTNYIMKSDRTARTQHAARRIDVQWARYRQEWEHVTRTLMCATKDTAPANRPSVAFTSVIIATCSNT